MARRRVRRCDLVPLTLSPSYSYLIHRNYSFCSTSCQKFVPLLSTAPCILKQVSYQELDASTTRTIQDPKHLGLPREILELVYAFPLGFRDCAHTIVDFAKYI